MTRLTLLIAVTLLALAGVAYLLTLGVRVVAGVRAAGMAEPQVITWRVTEALHPGVVDDGVAPDPDRVCWGDPKTRPINSWTRRVLSPADPKVSDYQEDDLAIFVHGWRMRHPERKSFAETSFKRMWWSGYKGQFATFDWPTEWVDLAGLTGTWLERVVRAGMDTGNFNRSEEIAWHSATPLAALIEEKAAGEGKVHVLAHSMGNIVAGEALNLIAAGGKTDVVGTYIAMQAAVADDLYHATAGPLSDYYVPFAQDNGLPQVGGGAPRFSDIDVAAEKLINYYNADDDALESWRFNDRFRGKNIHSGENRILFSGLQPGHSGHYSRDLSAESPTYYRVDGGDHTDPLNAIALDPANRWDLYEMLVNALHTQGELVVGRKPKPAVSPFTIGRDLSLALFRFSNMHSAQFEGGIFDVHAFWKGVVDDLA